MKRSKAFWFLFFVFLAAIAVRIAVNHEINGSLGATPDPRTDEGEYTVLAQNIIKGYGLSYNADQGPTAFRVPAYPLFLAGLFWLTDGVHYPVVRLVQMTLNALAGLLLVLLVYRLTSGNEKAAFWTAVFSVLYPTFYYHAGHLLTESLYIVLLVPLHWFLFRFHETMKMKSLVISGLLAGLLCMIRPNTAIFVGLLYLWFWLIAKDVRKSAVYFAIMLAGLFLAVTPWIVRNYIHYNRIQVLSTNGGLNFWGSNNPEMLKDPGYLLDKYNNFPGEIIYDISNLPGSETLAVPWQDRRYRQFDVNRRCWKLGLDYLKNHPEAILPLVWNKFKRFFGGPTFGPGWRNGLFNLAERSLFILAVLGFVLSFKLSRPPHYLALFFISVLASCLIFFSTIRMRVGIAPVLIVYAGIAAAAVEENIVRFWSVTVQRRKGAAAHGG